MRPQGLQGGRDGVVRRPRIADAHVRLEEGDRRMFDPQMVDHDGQIGERVDDRQEGGQIVRNLAQIEDDRDRQT